MKFLNHIVFKLNLFWNQLEKNHDRDSCKGYVYHKKLGAMNKIKIDIPLSLSSDIGGNPLFLENSENSQDSRHDL